MIPKVPTNCLICGAPWRGGCQLPGERYPRKGLRVFYDCGASLSIIDEEKERGYKVDDDYCYFLRLKNCNAINSDWEYHQEVMAKERIADIIQGLIPEWRRQEHVAEKVNHSPCVNGICNWKCERCGKEWKEPEGIEYDRTQDKCNWPVLCMSCNYECFPFSKDYVV